MRLELAEQEKVHNDMQAANKHDGFKTEPGQDDNAFFELVKKFEADTTDSAMVIHASQISSPGRGRPVEPGGL